MQHHGRTGQMRSTPTNPTIVHGDTPTEAIDMTALFAEQSRDGLLDSI
jgi:hypothetical protein